MKRLLYFFALLLPILTQAESTSADSLSTGSRFDAANRLYAQSKFLDAATAYEKIIADGVVSPALYFNLGNAYFKSGQMGHAIAAYRHAEELSPRDPDVRANVQFARNLVPGPKIGLPRWRQTLGMLSVDEWVALTTAAVWITFLLLSARLIKPALAPSLRSWTGIAIAGLGLVLGCAKLATSQSAAPRTAIIVISEATIRNSPFEESPAAFTAHDGAELRVLDRKNDWLQVTDGKQSTGWIKLAAVELSGRS